MPQVFSPLYSILLVSNFATGAILAITRFAMFLPFAFITFHFLDVSLLSCDEDNITWDWGFGSWLSAASYNYKVTNPLRVGFLMALKPDAHNLHGSPPKEE